MRNTNELLALVFGATVFLSACQSATTTDEQAATEDSTLVLPDGRRAISAPLVTHVYTADPSAHVFEDRVYIYPSHDVASDVPQDDLGSHFDMRDYHVFSMETIPGEVTDHGVVLTLEDIPWASRQLWAPDAAERDGKYYFYFPAKDEDDIFRIGVAVGDSPAGPFEARPEPIPGSYSMDPAVFRDDDGSYYMYFGGIWGGQLQRWKDGVYDPNGSKTDLQQDDAPSIMPRSR